MEARYLTDMIVSDALNSGKMAFVSGPRQVGKTTLAKSLLKNIKQNYFTWDDADFKRVWVKSPNQSIANRSIGPILPDEIHKDRKWKTRLKGIYDTQGLEIQILVTGSARYAHMRSSVRCFCNQAWDKYRARIPYKAKGACDPRASEHRLYPQTTKIELPFLKRLSPYFICLCIT